MDSMVSKKKWTVMVYMAGDNNLDAKGITDLADMKKIGSTSDINVVAEFDRAGTAQSTKRYLLSKGTSLDKDAKQSLGETNTGEPGFLVDFVKWAATNYPAEHYMLVLWNHGQGWDDTDIFAGERLFEGRLMRSSRLKHAFFRTSVVKAAKLASHDSRLARAILIDDNAKDFLDNLEMKKALLEVKEILGQKIDIFGMDACLMSMAEVAYQVRDCADYMVGSEQTEPLDGWPYDTILQLMVQNHDITAKDIGNEIVRKYIESYKETGDEVTFSSSDLSASEKFADAIEIMAQVLTAAVKDSASLSKIVSARNKSQEYEVYDNIDLINFCQLLKNTSVKEEIVKACDGVIDAVTGVTGLVLLSEYTGTSMKHSNGIAIYFPTRILSTLYETNLDFAARTKWGEFLKAFISATRSQ